jgi:hypothetical protein
VSRPGLHGICCPTHTQSSPGFLSGFIHLRGSAEARGNRRRGPSCLDIVASKENLGSGPDAALPASPKPSPTCQLRPSPVSPLPSLSLLFGPVHKQRLQQPVHSCRISSGDRPAATAALPPPVSQSASPDGPLQAQRLALAPAASLARRST